MPSPNSFDLSYNLGQIESRTLSFVFNYTHNKVQNDSHTFAFTYQNVQKELTFDLSYTVDTLETIYKTNLDNSRFMSNLPAWSTAYNSFFSNTAKLMDPMFGKFSGITGNIAEVMVNNLKEYEFGYQKDYYYYITPPNFTPPVNIKTEGGILSYIGEYGTSFLGNYPITAINLVAHSTPIFKDQITSTPIVLSQVSNIYFQCPDACVEGPVYFSMYGINEEGVSISEQVVMVSNDTYVSMNKYKAITRYISSDTTNIYTYIDCSTQLSYTNSFGPQKFIADSTGNYIQPVFTLDGQYLKILNGNNLGNAEISTYYLNKVPTKAFVSSLFDVFYLNGTDLYSSKLYNDITKLQYNSSYNNNDFIYLNVDQPKVGDVIKIGIKMQNVIQTYGTNAIRLTAITNGTPTNIDLNGDPTTSNQMTVPNSVNFLYIPYTVTSTDDTQFVLTIAQSNQQYAAGYYFNTVPEYHLASNVTDMFFKNNELFIEVSGNVYSINPTRPFFMSSTTNGMNVVILPSNYSEIDFNV